MKTAEFLVLFSAIILIGLLLTLVNFALFLVAGFEDKINSPIFYIILVLGWSLSVTWVISKIFKDDNIKN